MKRLLSTARLVTLTGVGGIGKTRLALEVAREVLFEYADGVRLVELAALTDLTLVPKAVAGALGVREELGGTLPKAIVERLKRAETLLVLDECEHVIEACATLVRPLLDACPKLHVLATSREPLRLSDEITCPVPALSLPNLEAGEPLERLAEYGSVALFLEQARAIKPDFVLTEENVRTVVEICRRLDGLPLAIELATTRLKLLPAEALLARLETGLKLLTGGARDLPARQRTMRGAIDWSYNLLTEEERALLRRLSVFAGGFSLEAAEVICAGGNLDEDTIFDVLTRLTDKSLAHVSWRGDLSRYGMLETIRQYASEKLQEAREESNLRAAHCEWFSRLAADAERELVGSRQNVWFSRLEAEHDNFRAALHWSSTAEGHLEACVRLCCALGYFWAFHNHWDEGRRRLEQALAASQRLSPSLRADALYWAAHFARLQGDLKRAMALVEESVALRRELNDRSGLAGSLYRMGYILLRQGDLAGALLCADESLTIAQELADPIGIADTANLLGHISRDRGEYVQAAFWYDTSLTLHRELGRSEGIASLLHNLGELARDQGEFEQANRLYQESLILSTELDDKHISEKTYHALGEIARYQGDCGRAEALYERSLAEARGLGDKQQIAVCLTELGNLANDRGDRERALSLYKDALAMDREHSYKLIITLVLDGFACTAAAQGEARRALRLAGAAAALRDASRLVLSPSNQAVLDRYLNEARQALGPDASQQAIGEGCAMRLEQAIEYALSG